MKLHRFSTFLCAALLLTGCVNGDDERVNSAPDNRIYICTTANVAAPSISFTQNLNNNTITFDISDLELTTGNKISFKTPLITYGLSETEGGVLAQCGSFGIGEGLTINEFKYLSCYNSNWAILTITINDEVYEYNSMRTFGGNTTTVTDSDSEPYTTSDTTFGIILLDSSTANVYIYNPRFAERMPEGMTLMVPDLEMSYGVSNLYEIVNDGDVVPFYLLNGNKLPYEAFTISEFKCTINPQGGNATLMFVCPAGTVTVDNMRPI